MNPATLALIIQGIEAAISAAPQVIDVAEKGKALIASLFSAGAISEEQQNQVFAHVNNVAAAWAGGQTPPSWQVQADPGSTPPPSTPTGSTGSPA